MNMPVPMPADVPATVSLPDVLDTIRDRRAEFEALRHVPRAR